MPTGLIKAILCIGAGMLYVAGAITYPQVKARVLGFPVEAFARKEAMIPIKNSKGVPGQPSRHMAFEYFNPEGEKLYVWKPVERYPEINENSVLRGYCDHSKNCAFPEIEPPLWHMLSLSLLGFGLIFFCVHWLWGDTTPPNVRDLIRNGRLENLRFEHAMVPTLVRSVLGFYLLCMGSTLVAFTPFGRNTLFMAPLVVFGWWRLWVYVYCHFVGKPFLQLSPNGIVYWQGIGERIYWPWAKVGQIVFLHESSSDHNLLSEGEVTPNTPWRSGDILYLMRTGGTRQEYYLARRDGYVRGMLKTDTKFMRIPLTQFGSSYHVAARIKAYLQQIGQDKKLRPDSSVISAWGEGAGEDEVA